MATLRQYWADIDRLSIETIEAIIPILKELNIITFVQNDKAVLEMVKDLYVRDPVLIANILEATKVGYEFYKSILESTGITPVKLTNDELSLQGKRALRVYRSYISNEVDYLYNRMSTQVIEMKARGMGDKVIRDYLISEKDEVRPVFHQFLNKVKKVVDDALDRAGNMVYNEGMRKKFGEDETLFEWISVGDNRVCPDCLSRHKQVKTLKEWFNVGIPGGGFTLCLSSCRCIILPTEYVDDELDLSKPVYRKDVKIKEGKIVEKM